MTADKTYLKLSVVSTGMHTSVLRYSHSLTHRTGTESYRLTTTASSFSFHWSDVNLCFRLRHLSVSDGVFISAFLFLNDFMCLSDPFFFHLECSGGSGDFWDGYCFQEAAASFVYLPVLFPLFISHMGCCGKLPWSNIFPGKAAWACDVEVSIRGLLSCKKRLITIPGELKR